MSGRAAAERSRDRFAFLIGLLFATAFLVAGCGGGGGDGGSSPPPPPPTPPSKIFIGDSGTVAIGSSPTSNPSPGAEVAERIIEGPSTMLSSSLTDFALHVASDRLYVADLRSILVFDNISTAEGDIAPSRVVFTCCGGAGNYVGIYLDTANDRLYAAANVALGGAQVVHVFDNVSTLSNSPPNRTITVPPTFLMDVAVDATRDILYVYGRGAISTLTEIAVFDSAATLSGTATQNRTIAIGESFSSGPAVGMFIDPANNRLYAPRTGAVMVFDNASTKSGDINTTAAPARTINLPLLTLSNIFVELTADRLYATDTGGVTIIPNASTVNGTSLTGVRAIASPGSIFKATAVAP